MARIITFGELMLRLQPYNYERFVQCDHVEFTFGGGEANVAVSLANYGMDVAFVTKLPAHAIGQAAVNSLRRYGVDTTKIVRGGERVGIYFNEKGASQRGSVCIYDRAHSAIQQAAREDFDWDKIFEGVEWFHFTGITPALGPNVVDICRVSDTRLVGESPERVRHFMEIRGIGIIDIRAMYGIGAVKLSTSIDLVIHMEKWDSAKEYDRLGLTDESIDILDVKVPYQVMPVKPGRNVAIIIEVAARNLSLKRMGYNAAHELDRRLTEMLMQNS